MNGSAVSTHNNKLELETRSIRVVRKLFEISMSRKREIVFKSTKPGTRNLVNLQILEKLEYLP